MSKRYLMFGVAALSFALSACDGTDPNRQASFDMRYAALAEAEKSPDGIGIASALIRLRIH